MLDKRVRNVARNDLALLTRVAVTGEPPLLASTWTGTAVKLSTGNRCPRPHYGGSMFITNSTISRNSAAASGAVWATSTA
jgi:hypothetical protein